MVVANMERPTEAWVNDGGCFVDSGLGWGAVPLRGFFTRPALGDLDGDGDLTVFVGSLMGRPEIWLNATSAEVIESLNACLLRLSRPLHD